MNSITQLLFILFFYIPTHKHDTALNKDKHKFTNITKLLSINDFEKVKSFILENGDRQTYRNFDGNNPHYKFENFDVFLGSDIGQENISNDTAVSDFNQLVIADWESHIIYYEIVIVREGDIEKKKMWLEKGMKENRVYLVDIYGNGILKMRNRVVKYLNAIKKKIFNSK